MTPVKEVRVRIAPSPTGWFHVGTARTALFNWIFAKKQGGKFILRIEDTDLERSDPKFENDIINSLKWLGLDWDEGPYRQSERLDIYEKHITALLEKGLIYYCFCSKEELEGERQAQLSQGLPPRYSGKCRYLDAEEVKKRREKGEPSVLRLRIPETKISFKDIIRGEISFDTALMGDIIVAKNTRAPLYNFAVVIDDEEMAISHIIRGEDHLPNTPKQILLQEALGFNRPKYAHLPLILDSNRSKLSKRYSSTAIQDYKKEGYLANAFVNFLLLLGWHPASDEDTREEKEIFNKEEMIKAFDLKRVQKGGAAFDINKLNWINSQYIKQLDNAELAEKLGLNPDPKNLKIITLIKERMVKLTDFKDLADFFYTLPDYPAQLLIWKNSTKENALKYLEIIYTLGDNLNENEVRALAEERGRGEVLWPLRAALSGKQASPSPFEIMDALGKEETLNRVKIAIEKIK